MEVKDVMEPITQPAMAQAIEAMWGRFLPLMEERVAVLESAETALSSGLLTIEQRSAANAAAHKLAGVLGTFGLTRGTILARKAEILYSAEPEFDPAAARELKKITVQLREMIECRKAAFNSDCA
jgi:HPt (histidine-containing phosphotransfer) domain-containing protein